MNRLKETRFRKGKTQIQLFKETGIWASRISYIENGYMKPRKKEKQMLAEALCVDENWLFPKQI
ncbi:MAG: helix-turn-helix domain-containing protein [Candidatus Hodarchaeales archaeon]|jgi:transcriptional regulator with XRE-family HTH domain